MVNYKSSFPSATNVLPLFIYVKAKTNYVVLSNSFHLRQSKQRIKFSLTNAFSCHAVSSLLCFLRVYNSDSPSLNVTRFKMDDHIPSPPLYQPKTLSQLILRPWFATIQLIQYLTIVPNALDSHAALTKLCTRDFQSIFAYLLSLNFTDWHRRFLMQTLAPRLEQLPISQLKLDIAPLLPSLTALWFDPQEKQTFPIMGPFTDMETSHWEIHDWFYQLIHAKQMEGTFCHLYSHVLYCVSILTYTHLELRFS